MKNVVGNKVEANRRGKGMGPSCLITKAFSCHLACRTGFIIYLIFLFQAALAAIIKIITSLLPYALFTYIHVKPAVRDQEEGPSPGSMASTGDRLGRAVTRGHLHRQPAWLGQQPGGESLLLSLKFSSKGFPAPPHQQ